MHPESTHPKQRPPVRVLNHRGRRHRSLHKSLLRCALTAQTSDELLHSLIGELKQHCQPALILFYRPAESENQASSRILYQQSASTPDTALLSQLNQVCQNSIQSKEVEIQPCIDINFMLYAAPITARGQAADALGAVFPATNSTEPFSLLLQAVATHITLWHTLREGLQQEQHARDSAAIVELLSNLSRSTNFTQAAGQTASDLADYLGCRQIAIGSQDTTHTRCRLVGLSGCPQFDKAAKSVGLIEAALDETLRQQSSLVWTDQHSTENHELQPLQTVGEQLQAISILCVPLASSDQQADTVVCVVDLPLDRLKQTQCLLEAAGQPLANALHAAQRRSRLTGNWKTALRQSLQGKTRRMVLAACLLFTALMFVPWPYQVKCACQLEPVMQRFVVAPFAGSLETMLVEPGDLVHQGDVLARMDPRELKWKRASLISDQKQAIKRRDSAQAARDFTTQQLSRLEAERLGLEIELLDHRINNLEIKSPVDGIVVAGTLNWAEGAPLEIGEALFEIAPLDQMVVEVAVPDSEISHVREAQSVHIRLEALPDSDQTLQLERIHPRAELRDDANIFVAEAAVDNSQGLLRPGMKGRASIQTAPQPVYWILFHKPWNLIRKYLY